MKSADYHSLQETNPLRDERSVVPKNHETICFKEARKGFFGCYSVCETMKDTKEGYFIM